MFLKILLITALVSMTCAFEDNDLYGISHIGMTVKNLELSTRYYQDVFGSMLVEDLSTGDEGVSGDSHYYRIFQKEIMENETVPDIRTEGTHEVRWNFLLMPNFMILLMEFRNCQTRQVYYEEDPKIGNAIIGSNHACILANENVIPLQHMESILEQQSKFPEMDDYLKDFITYVGPDPNTFAERNARPLSEKLASFAPNFMLSSTRGPVGEKWEVLYLKGDGLINHLQPFCEYKGVLGALLNVPPDNKYQRMQGMNGLHHINAVVQDLDKALKFYITILGGKLNEKTSGSQIPLDKLNYDIIYQDEVLEAKRLGVAPDLDFGIVPPIFEGPGQPLWDIYFIAFDNTYYEPYRYYINSTYKQIPSNLYRTRISPAFVNVIHTGFWVKENVNMVTFIKSMESQSSLYGLDKVKANRAIAVGSLGQAVNDNQYSDPFPDGHHLAGFDYTFFKGPSGEQNVLVQFKGKAKNALQAAMERYGALSTAFSSTNPWNWAGFNKMCDWVNENLNEAGDGSMMSIFSSSSLQFTMFLAILLFTIVSNTLFRIYQKF